MNFVTDQYVGLYFYSAVFQGNMALLALVGVFAVFRIQILRSSLDGTSRSLVQMTRDHFGLSSALPMLPKLQLFDIVKLREQLKEHDYASVAAPLLASDSYIQACSHYDSMKTRLDIVKSKLETPLWSTIAVIGLSLVLLPLAHFINLNMHYIEPWLIIVTVVTNGFALYKNVTFVIWAID